MAEACNHSSRLFIYLKIITPRRERRGVIIKIDFYLSAMMIVVTATVTEPEV